MRGLLILLVLASTLFAAAPPQPLSGTQAKRLAQGKAFFAAANRHYRAKEYLQACEAVLRGLAISREIHGRVPATEIGWLTSAARLFESEGKPSHAIPLWEELLELRTAYLGPQHYRTIDARWELHDAKLNVRLSVEQRKALDLATKLNLQVFNLWQAGQSRVALPLAKRALSIRQKILGNEHPQVAQSLMNLASQHLALEEFEPAEKLLRDSLRVRVRAQGRGHPDYARGLTTLGALLQSQCNYPAAIELHAEAFAVVKQTLGEEDELFATVMNNYAVTYSDMGNHEAAILFLRWASEILKRTAEKGDPGPAASLINLARVYNSQAESLIHKLAFDSPAEDGKLAKGVLMQAMTRYFAAERVLDEAEKRCKELGEDHPVWGIYLDTRAMTHAGIGRHKEARQAREKALASRFKGLGDKHPEYQRDRLAMLIRSHEDEGDHGGARKYREEMLAIEAKTVGKKHPSYALQLGSLAENLLALGDLEAARARVEEALTIRNEVGRLTAAAQTERQQANSAQGMRRLIDLRLSLPDPGKDAAASYRHLLSWKGSILGRELARRRALRMLADARPEVKELAGKLDDASRDLARLSHSDRASRGDFEQLTALKDTLEGRLASVAKDLTPVETNLAPDALRARLPAGHALIDFVHILRYEPARKGSADRSPWYIAYIVRPDRPVIRVDLGSSIPIHRLITEWRKQKGRQRRGETSPGDLLRRMLWLPLERHLDGIHTVLVAPDAMLTGMPFAALPGGKRGSFLIEERTFVLVPVPGLLPGSVDDRKTPEPSFLLVGDVDFGKAGSWPALPGTRGEIEGLSRLFADRLPRARVTKLRQAEATQRGVREALGRHTHVHLATHGYFTPADTASNLGTGKFHSEFARGMHPLLQAGIVLAGVNDATPDSADQGILTGLELARQDLSGVDLAVLSACETGLGEVAGGEGVLGLQRALQVAGARTTVASLWQVSDAATRELMLRFYANLLSGKMSRAEALRQAQLWLLREGRRNPGILRGQTADFGEDEVPRLPPAYWAAFVLAGEWR